jgi:hypothetical protein
MTDLSHPQQFRGAPGVFRVPYATRSECITLRPSENFLTIKFNLPNCPWALPMGDASYYKSYWILCSTSYTPPAHGKYVQKQIVIHE